MEQTPTTNTLVNDFGELLSVLGHEDDNTGSALDQFVALKRLSKAVKAAKAVLIHQANLQYKERFNGESVALNTGVRLNKKSPNTEYVYSKDVQDMEARLNAAKEIERETGKAKKKTTHDITKHQTFSIVVPFSVSKSDHEDLIDASHAIKELATDIAAPAAEV